MKFITGIVIGTASILVLPKVVWDDVSPFFNSIRKSVDYCKEAFKSYTPSELKKVKIEEIREENSKNSPVKFEISDESKNQRKKIQFYTELQQKMNGLQIMANHRALTKEEKVYIIRSEVKRHFPEYFPKDNKADKDEKKL